MAVYEITTEPTGIDFSGGENATMRILQNVKNLLMTRIGEIPYDRQRGFRYQLLDLPETELRDELLPEIDRVLLWEPNAEALDAWITATSESIVIHCTVDIDEGEEYTA